MSAAEKLGPAISCGEAGELLREAHHLEQGTRNKYRLQQNGNEYTLHKILKPGAAVSAPKSAAPVRPSGAHLESFADIQEEKLVTVFPSLLWRGKHTTIAGDPGLGKSVISVEIAARLTRGGKVSPYSDEIFPPCNVVMASSEDGKADTIKPRLRVAGADMRRVTRLGGVFGERGLEHTDLGRHLDELKAAIVATKAGLLILDPVTSFFGKGIDGNSQTDIRGVIDPVNAMLEETGCALLGIAHLNKATNLKAIYKIGGSIAMVGAPRAVYGFVRDGESKTARQLLPVKMNLAPEDQGFSLALVDSGGYPKIEWHAERSSKRIDDVLNPTKSKADGAADALRAFLADGAEHDSGLIYSAMREKGFGRDATRGGLDAVGVIRKKSKDGQISYRLRQVAQVDPAIWDEK